MHRHLQRERVGCPPAHQAGGVNPAAHLLAEERIPPSNCGVGNMCLAFFGQCPPYHKESTEWPRATRCFPEGKEAACTTSLYASVLTTVNQPVERKTMPRRTIPRHVRQECTTLLGQMQSGIHSNFGFTCNCAAITCEVEINHSLRGGECGTPMLACVHVSWDNAACWSRTAKRAINTSRGGAGLAA